MANPRIEREGAKRRASSVARGATGAKARLKFLKLWLKMRIFIKIFKIYSDGEGATPPHSPFIFKVVFASYNMYHICFLAVAFPQSIICQMTVEVL